ncbi:M48 family metallopeptidase [Parasporobacterium paucivorans]|uniref:YgjP-like metallopeptidase domain-containing protein n=1 Tax=Parasporobacterium paucivorans DSM 15970 TaxID=1122934 RepID=A0A1M6EN42_9FIRM|nr:M48 family metallopeptidase [Parasporobacterium paucivorans]SHI86955.1 hypothetical protein SAMN02745691_00957 [Parasporobacterium paucivorans DSM 15970]
MKKECEERAVQWNGTELAYKLYRKKVKNINLRIKGNGEIVVSAGNRIPSGYIDEFVNSKGQYIENAITRQKERLNNPVNVPAHPKQTLEDICKEVYNIFKPYSLAYPIIKTRKMTSRWGSCHPYKGMIILNNKLLEAPIECIEYVVLHEFAHFLHPNHSRQFYDFVEGHMPDWKERKALLRRVI